MPRRPRLHLPGGFYHAILRGNGRQAIFFDNEDRDQWHNILQEGLTRYHHRLHASGRDRAWLRDGNGSRASIWASSLWPIACDEPPQRRKSISDSVTTGTFFPCTVTSWRVRFEAQASLFFGAGAAWWLLAIGNSWLLLGEPLTNPTRIVYLSALGGFVYAALRPTRRLHAALAIIACAAVFPIMAAFFLMPDRFATSP